MLKGLTFKIQIIGMYDKTLLAKFRSVKCFMEHFKAFGLAFLTTPILKPKSINTWTQAH